MANPLALELGNDLAALIVASHDGGWSMVGALVMHGDGKTSENFAIGLNPACPAVSGELFRIYDDLVRPDALRLEIRDALRLALQPFVKTVGEIAFTPASGLHGGIIGSIEPRDDGRQSHSYSSSLDYSPQEARARFEATLRGALATPPQPKRKVGESPKMKKEKAAKPSPTSV